MKNEIAFYRGLLKDIKNRIRNGQSRANLSANAEILATYWDIGQIIHQRQQEEGWGKAVIPRLAVDLNNEISDLKGFSERNISRMVNFYREYSNIDFSTLIVSKLSSKQILPLPVAKLETSEITQIPDGQINSFEKYQYLIPLVSWSHHIILIQKIKDLPARYWYMYQIIENGWSRDALAAMIKSEIHLRQGKTINNFNSTLPAQQSELARSLLKDPYIFDFMTFTDTFSERELELELIKHVEKFLIELGAGFAFVGRQFKIEISDKDFYIDLLFYHLKMRCFIVIDLKIGDFIPEYAGKMNFYCSAVDDLLRHSDDKPTIGLILCQGKDKIFAEYSLKDLNKPIGISEYELTKALPEKFQGSLPSIAEIEKALSNLD